MTALMNVLAYPFGWALGLLYDLCHNYLIALLIITLVLRLILLPTSVKQQKNSAKQMRLQAKVNKIRAKYAGQQGREVQMKIQEETQELYKREGFNASTAGCAPLAFQMIVMMGLYGAIYSPLQFVLRLDSKVIEALTSAYNLIEGVADTAAKTGSRVQLNILGKFSEVVANLPKVENGELVTGDIIEEIQTFVANFKIFGIDLTQTPKDFKTAGAILIMIPVLAGVTAMLSAVYTFLKQRKTNPEMSKNPMMGCMTFMAPAMSVFFAWSLPAGIGFYWIISNILSFIQMVALALIFKPEDIIAAQMIDETVERRSREQSVKQTKQLLANRESKQQ